jgi:hypothetical protein
LYGISRIGIGHQQRRHALAKPIQHRQATPQPARTPNDVEDGRHDEAFGFEDPTNPQHDLKQADATESSTPWSGSSSWTM